MISRFFIDRPIFAAVLSIVITLAGFVAVWTLAVAQFPPVSPPTVLVTCNYPGASAKDVAAAVAAPIEQQVNGVDGMMYMSSACTNDGAYSLTVTFHHGVDLNMALVLVQNRVSLAVPLLPDVIKQTGVTVRKQSPDILFGIALRSPNGRYDQLYLSNFAVMQVKDELARLDGVSDVFIFGQRDNSMRVWVDPEALSARGLSASDVAQAIRDENAPVAGGAIGQRPAPKGQQLQMTLSTLGRLLEPEQFGDIVLKVTDDGRMTRLKDVARVELGAKSEDMNVSMDGDETVFLAIFQMPDANALQTHDRVLAKMDELKENFPEGIDYEIGFDTTPYTRESIKEVFKTLRDAVILVAVVVLLFLQNWRSAIIPLVAVPVAIIGTFAAMAAFGFSVNNLTLFGLVLAIGIVVDDAIVVVEAVEHHIEQGLAPREATIAAMRQVSGPVIAVGLVLSAVFIPCAFISGITGQFFRQFALTISVSTVISAFNSLTLSPALTTVLLRPRGKSPPPPLPALAFPLAGSILTWMFLTPWIEHTFGREMSSGFDEIAKGLDATFAGYFEVVRPWLLPAAAALAGAVAGGFVGGRLNRLLGWLFRAFDRAFHATTGLYVRAVGGLLRMTVLVLVVYGGLLGITYWRFVKTPIGFIPTQDMGYLMVLVQLPDAASTERTKQVIKKMVEIGVATPGVKHVSGIVGMSFALNANGPNLGSMFFNLKAYDERRDPALWSTAIVDYLRKKFAEKDLEYEEMKRKAGESDESYANRVQRRKTDETDDAYEKRMEKVAIRKTDETDDDYKERLKTAAIVPGEEAIVMVIPPPPVRGVGRAGGIMIMIEDRGDVGPHVLQQEVENLVRLGSQTPGFAQVISSFRANVPQLRVVPDMAQCMTRGVSMGDFADTLRIYQGSLYVNDFNKFGRTWQVIVQAEPRFRNRPETIDRLRVRNDRGVMVPLGSLASVEEVNGPLVLTRYNMYPAASIMGNAAPGVSSREAIDRMQRLAERELPRNMAYEWTEMSYLELLAGNTAMRIFAFAVLMVFLVLAAQYESWSLPLAVILVVPMCLLSALIGVNIAKLDVNIFTRIGFVVLVGLASKNAILIVEFAKHERAKGASRREATLAACRLRLRPIIMTSVAFILGVAPLLVGHGAGAEMRRALGAAVFSGMIGVTLFGLALTPVFFFTIDWLGGLRLFSLPLVRRASAVSAGLVSLKPLRQLAVYAGRQIAAATRRTPRRHVANANTAAVEPARRTDSETVQFVVSVQETQPDLRAPNAPAPASIIVVTTELTNQEQS